MDKREGHNWWQEYHQTLKTGNNTQQGGASMAEEKGIKEGWDSESLWSPGVGYGAWVSVLHVSCQLSHTCMPSRTCCTYRENSHVIHHKVSAVTCFPPYSINAWRGPQKQIIRQGLACSLCGNMTAEWGQPTKNELSKDT